MARRARLAPTPRMLPLLRCLIALAVVALVAAAAGQGGARAAEARAGSADGDGNDAAPIPAAPSIPTRTIHLVPHSHDDGGWLKTFSEYLDGARQDIQEASVGTNLDSVLGQLRLPQPRRNASAATPPTPPRATTTQEQRTFTVAEVGFFRAWWRRLPKRQRRRVFRLVRLGLLEFAGGGEVQHDEACPHYLQMLDQTTRGHRFLAATFGASAVPSISWQLDPFGHSAAHAELFGSPSGGHHAFIYGRSDWRDRQGRAARRELEHVWRPSLSFTQGSADVLALAYSSGNYGPPPGLDWNWGTSPNGPIIDDPKSPDYNGDAFLKTFDEAARASFASASRGSSHALWMMGSDFTYAAAAHYYRNMDRLVRLVNGRAAQGGEAAAYRVVYSTPGRYLAARAAEAAEEAAAGGSGDNTTEQQQQEPPPPPPSPAPPLSLRRDDLFPYSDDPHSFWTGYFSSRPESKLMIRAASARLQAARQLAALSRIAAAARAAADGGGGGGGGNGSSDHADEDKGRPAPPSSSSSSSPSPLSRLPPWERSALPGGCERLEAAAALAQHHDAVTGTAKQAVVRDYHRRIYQGMGDADALIGEALRRLMRTTVAPALGRRPRPSSPPSAAAAASAEPPEPRPYPRVPDLLSCPMLNVSHCAHSAGPAAARGFLLVAYNPLSRLRVAAPLRVPVRVVVEDDGDGNSGDSSSSSIISPNLTTFQVWEMVGGVGFGWRRPVPSQLLPRSDATARLQASSLAAVAGGRRARRAELEGGFGTHDLAFVADEVPALGYSTFLVERVPAAAVEEAGRGGRSGSNGDDDEGPPLPAAPSSEQRFGRGGDPVPPGAWPKPVVVGNYDGSAAAECGGVRLSFDYLSGRLSSVIGGGGFSPQGGGGGGKGGGADGDGNIGGGGWGPLPATMALASYLPHVGKAGAAAQAAAVDAAASSPSSSSSSSSSSCAAAAAVLGPRDPRTAARAAFAAAVLAATNADANATTTAATLSNVAGAEQSSGAYIFRPDHSRPRALDAALEEHQQQQQGDEAPQPPPPIPATALRGPVLTEVRQEFSPQGRWASLALRVWPLPAKRTPPDAPRPRRTAGAASAAAGAVVEVEWTVGPLLLSPHASAAEGASGPPPPLGREAIFRLSTALLSEGAFFTDANGREMQQRRRGRRPWRWPGDFYFEPQAANYYPITSGVALGDGELTATVSTDRAQGAASLSDGELEVMVHRATPADDARGVGEPLRETAGGCRAAPAPRDPDGSVPTDACGRDAADDGSDEGPETPPDGGGGLIARGTFRVRFSPSRDAARLSRLDQEELLSPLVLAFAPLRDAQDVAAAERAFGGGRGVEEEEAEESGSPPAAPAAAAPRWGLSLDAPDGGIGGGDPDTPIRVVTFMRSDGLHGMRDAEELCEDPDDEEEEADDDGGDGQQGGSLTPPLRCGAQAEAAAAALPSRYLVRLAHVFAAGEHPDKMSKPATFDLNVLFARAGFGLSVVGAGGGVFGGGDRGSSSTNDLPRIKRVTELSLTASVPRSDLPPRPRWRVAEDDGGGRGGGDAVRGGETSAKSGPATSWPGAPWRGPVAGAGGQPTPSPTYDPREHGVGEDAERVSRGIVELFPMEVRTFEVELLEAGSGGGGGGGLGAAAAAATTQTAVV